MEIKEYKIEIFLPDTHVQIMRDRLNEIGVLKVGNYDHVMTISQVTGYWRPLEGAKPYSSKVGEIRSAPECKMELRCGAELVKQALAVIREIHPYEEPVINILPLMN